MEVMPNNCVRTIEKTSQQRATTKWTRIYSAIKKYTSESTLHGIGYVFHGGSKIRRFIWLVFLLTCMIFCIFQTWTLTSRYLDYPVSTKTKIVNADQILFPAVTICNFNPLRQSEEHILAQLLNKRDWDTLNFADIIERYGHTMDEEGMLVRCTWKGKTCNSSDFYTTITELGLCHTFNSGPPKFPLEFVTSPGISSGLQLTLNVQVYEYNISTSDIGLKVRVHDQREPALIANLGFAVMPGSKALVSITKKKVIALPEPYESKCTRIPEKESYSKAYCLANCKDNFFMKICGCVEKPTKIEQINTTCTWKKYQECYKPNEENFVQEGIKNCNCAEACTRVSFETDLSYSLFNQVENTSALLKAFNETKADIYGISEKEKWTQFLRTNVLELVLFYDEMCYEQNEDVHAYPFTSFVAEIGGTLGSFLGASALTIMELLDLFCQIFVISCRKTS